MMYTDRQDRADVNRAAFDQLAGEYEERTTDRVTPTSVVVERVAAYAPNGPVIDIGCGVGLLVRLLLDRGISAVGIDFSKNMVAYARERNGADAVMWGDFMEHPFGTRFGAVVAMGVLHLVPSAEAAEVVARLRDLVEPGGILYVTTTRAEVPDEGFMTKDHYSGAHVRYRRRWTEPELAQLLTNGDLQIIERLYVEDDDDRVWMNFVARRPVTDS